MIVIDHKNVGKNNNIIIVSHFPEYDMNERHGNHYNRFRHIRYGNIHR